MKAAPKPPRIDKPSRVLARTHHASVKKYVLERLSFAVSRLNREWIPYFVLGVSLLVTTVVAVSLHRSSRAQERAQFENSVRRTRDSIQTRLEIYTSMLRGAAALFQAEPDRFVEAAQFQAYVSRLELRDRYPGVQGVAYSAAVRPEEKEAFEASIRSRGGLPDFRIWPDHPRSQYHAVIYLHPMTEGNLGVLGFDMFTSAPRRAAMEAARDRGTAAVTTKVNLVQKSGPDLQPGFLLYVPVYRADTIPASVEQRQRELQGFVVCAFRVRDLLAGIHGTENFPNVDFQLFDGPRTEPSLLLHDSTISGRNRPGKGRYSSTLPISLASHTWTVRVTDREVSGFSLNRALGGTTALAGLLISSLLFVVIRAQIRARREAEAFAQNLMASEAALFLETRTLETMNYIGRLISGELDLDKLVSAVTDAATQVSGARFGVFVYPIEDRGSSRLMFSLSGLDRSAIGRTLYDSPSALLPDLQRRGVLRSDDVRTDPRFKDRAPNAILPVTHPPIASYMAVPVVSRSGQILGALFLGHDQPAEFEEREERIVSVFAGQVAIAMDNALLLRETHSASRAKDEFLATLSHELRTPMTAILGWANLLERGGADPDTMETGLRTIHRSAVVQAQLIDDVLDVSRIISGKLRLNIQPINVGELARAAEETLRPAAEAKDLTLRLSFPPDLPLIAADPNRMQQVIWNLLSNAIKFTPKGGAIDLTAERRRGAVRLLLTDTGQGIRQEFLPHVFEAFRQADSSSTRIHGGLGLGLAIVRSLVELHGGTIRAESEGPDLGARFIVEMPLAPDRPQEQTELPLSAPSPRIEKTKLQGMRMLVVDDEPGVRGLLEAILEGEGAAVVKSPSALEALHAIKTSSFDVVITDIAMPVMDGYTLVSEIRKTSGAEELPVIALTAYGRAEDRDRVLSSGFQAYLKKPIDPQTLVDAVAAFARETKKPS